MENGYKGEIKEAIIRNPSIITKNAIIGTFIKNYGAALLAAAVKRGLSITEAEDAVQDFGVYLCGWSEERIKGVFKSWQYSFGYIRNRFIWNLLTKQKRDRKIQTMEIVEEITRDQSAITPLSFIVKEEVMKFREIISKKTRSEKNLIIFDLMIQGRTTPEISEITNIKRGSIRTCKRRIREILKKYI